jgi:hypothetical protein
MNKGSRTNTGSLHSRPTQPVVSYFPYSTLVGEAFLFLDNVDRLSYITYKNKKAC